MEHQDESLLMTILNTLLDGLICIDHQGTVYLFNRSAEKIFGYRADEVVGNNISMLMPEASAKIHSHFIAQHEQFGEYNVIGVSREIKGRRKDGTEFPIEIAIGDVTMDGQHLYTGIVKDITKRKRNEAEIEKYRRHLEELVAERTRELTAANEKLKELINVDALTGIANRRYFNEVIESEIRRAIRQEEPVSLLMCDIDYFKDYNDQYGHLAGDDCLMKIAGCFKETFLRVSDLYARYGGEEFAVILPYTNGEMAQKLAEKLCENVKSLRIEHGSSPISNYVTISIGVATAVPVKGYKTSHLIKCADQALYQAKSQGRDRVYVSTEDQSQA